MQMPMRKVAEDSSQTCIRVSKSKLETAKESASQLGTTLSEVLRKVIDKLAESPQSVIDFLEGRAVALRPVRIIVPRIPPDRPLPAPPYRPAERPRPADFTVPWGRPAERRPAEWLFLERWEERDQRRRYRHP